jgi:hypothetical protein
MALPDLTGLNIEDTYQRILQTDGVNIYDGTGSLVNIVETGSFATTGSNTFIGNQTIQGDVAIAGTASIAFLNVAIESASIIYSSGSNQFGDAANDTQTLFGNVIVPTGSLTITGSVSSKGTFISTATYPSSIGFATNGSSAYSTGFHTNIWRGTLNYPPVSFVANAYIDSATNYALIATRPSTPTFSQFQLYVKTDNTSVIDLAGGGPILDIANNGTVYSRFDGTNFSIGAASALARLYAKGTGTTSATTAFRVDNANASASLVVLDNGTVGVGTATTSRTLQVNGSFRVNRTNQTFQYWDLETGEANFGRLRHISDSNNQKGLTISNILAGATPAGFWNFISLEVQNGEALRIDAARNIGIGTISPSASLHISGASSATLFEIDSPAVNNIMFVTGSGRVGIGTNAPAYLLDVSGSSRVNGTLFTNAVSFRPDGLTSIIPSNDSFNPANNGNQLRFTSNLYTTAGYGYNFINATSTLVWTSGTGGLIYLFTGYAPTSGTGQYRFINIEGTINQTGGANGITRGLYLAPTLTAAADWRSIENTVGNNLLNSTSGNTYIGLSTNTGTAKLQIRGAGATSATNTFIIQNSTPTNLLTIQDNGQFTFTSPVISLATSQSAFTISQSISQSAVIGAQVYGVNITPTFFATTASQTETALRVAATFTGSAAAVGGQNIIADFGATSIGSQLTVTDVTSGSIYMVNDVSGLPIIEATSNWDVNMYNFPNKVFEKTGNRVNIYGTLNATGSFVLPLSQSASPTVGTAYWSGSYLFVYDGTQYRSASFA